MPGQDNRLLFAVVEQNGRAVTAVISLALLLFPYPVAAPVIQVYFFSVYQLSDNRSICLIRTLGFIGEASFLVVSSRSVIVYGM